MMRSTSAVRVSVVRWLSIASIRSCRAVTYAISSWLLAVGCSLAFGCWLLAFSCGLLCGSLPSLMNADFAGCWLLAFGCWLACCAVCSGCGAVACWVVSVGWLVVGWVVSPACCVVSVVCVIAVLFYRFGAKISAMGFPSKEIAQMLITS